ncbi:putative uncharacterized protein DDB_G0279653 [Octopus sinensis]|uniref:Uncharacterized protein n=1 Tax=Octopus sinensis TaxID=2607531 RepID=A0A6P7TI22_9MOLL|nr:putative uncharacterized protein DDB_G0279653 [Octopus sinensis]
MNRFLISKEEIDIVLLARKTIIEFEGKLWTRADTPNNFEIPMGSSDSAEITDLVGAYLLKCIKREIPELQGGLYRDDALFVIPSNSKSSIERIRKKINKFFKDFNLSITYEPGTKIVNFLDITLDLNSKLPYPFRKEALSKAGYNQEITFLDKESLHLPKNEENINYVNKNIDRARYKNRFMVTKNPVCKPNHKNKNIDQNISNSDKTNLDKSKKHTNKSNTNNNSRGGNNNSSNPKSNLRKYNKENIIWLNVPFN